VTTEKGVTSAKRAGHSARVWRAPTWEHVEVALDRADNELTSDDWLIVDSGTKMQILLHRWWLGRQHEENEARDLDILEPDRGRALQQYHHLHGDEQ